MFSLQFAACFPFFSAPFIRAEKRIKTVGFNLPGVFLQLSQIRLRNRF